MSRPNFCPGIPGIPSTVWYPEDNTLFTTADWQGKQPQTAEEIPLFTWVQVSLEAPEATSLWKDAVIVDGLPRSIR